MRTYSAFATLLALTSVSASPIQRREDGFIGIAAIQEGCPDTHEIEVLIEAGDKDYIKASELIKRVANNCTQIMSETENEQFKFVTMKTTHGVHEALGAMVETKAVSNSTKVTSRATQTGSPWGLQRISTSGGASGSPQGQDFTYAFDDAKLGEGVDIYIVDTGVRTTHAVFNNRAKFGFSATGSQTDGDGHGTHVAGTSAGLKFGVAQKANIIAVKVLGDDGSGSSADTISGIDYVIKQHTARKSQQGFVGSIISMSLGLGGRSDSLESALEGATKAGIHISVASGNEATDACGSSPGALGGSNSALVSVGAINIENTISEFSNTGKCVDLYAPGEQILSSWNTGDNVINFLSGTSMACPHVTGVLAYLMAEDPATLGQDPAALKEKLLSTARNGAITGNTNGGANLLLSNGADSKLQRLVKNWVVPDANGDVPAEKRTSIWARDTSLNLDKRWELHSNDSPLRF
ncbi:subtilisin-like protein [Polyplosphaeria fusca]|uniref:Subtilisin-like protein n=1 Tax=Polyplosphaeria fusca TaxID=682080 RepID=A0A9P4QXC3_9PLEO|nr:subtilisin-like protein [Polyplosphaeria fusca]